jgi:hypothetical protein
VGCALPCAVLGRPFLAITLLGLSACPGLASKGQSTSQAKGEVATRTSGDLPAEDKLGAAPVTSIPDPNDALRDPRERHLWHVRQLTSGGRVAFPVFTADGQSLIYLKARGGSVQLQRLALASKNEQVLPTGAGEPFSLTSTPSGLLCLGLAPPSCKLNPLPQPWSALHCTAMTTTAAASALDACPQPKPVVPALPCVLSVRGERACPVLDASGATLLLYPRDAGLVRPLGQGHGVDFSPTFSSDGLLLAWLSTRPMRDFSAESPLTRIQLLEVDALPTVSRGLGPDQTHELDPGWFPGKHRLIFASTADDAAGLDYDLFALDADGGNLIRLTFSPGTDRFPALSPDGKTIAWVSERNFAAKGDEDLFIADWLE